MRTDFARRSRSRLRVKVGRSKTERVADVTAGRRTLELRTLQNFRLVFGSARRFDTEVRRAAGISGSLLWALSEIASTASMSVNQLADRMALHQTTASNIVNGLLKRNLIRRSRAKLDQRVAELQILAAGARVLREVSGPHAGLLVDALKRLDGDKLVAVERSLAIVLAEMRVATTHYAGNTLLGE